MTVKHIHKFKKHKYPNGTAIFFCTLDCNFKIEVPLAVGKECLCHICNEPFTMNEHTIRMVRPHCINCGKMAVKVDGKKHYIDKRRTNALAEVAQEEVKDLRQRLDEITGDDNL